MNRPMLPSEIPHDWILYDHACNCVIAPDGQLYGEFRRQDRESRWWDNVALIHYEKRTHRLRKSFGAFKPFEPNPYILRDGWNSPEFS